MTNQLEQQTDHLVALLLVGDCHAAERAGAIRARRHAGPGARAFVRLKPRLRATDAATEPVAWGHSAWRRGADS